MQNPVKQYTSRSDYMAQRPQGSKIKKLSLPEKSSLSNPEKPQISNQAKELNQQKGDLDKDKLKAKGQQALDSAKETVKTSLKTPPITPLLGLPDAPDLPKVEEVKEIEKIEKDIKPKSLNKPAIIFVSGFDLGFLESRDGVREMADNIEGSDHFSWSDEEEILERIMRTPREKPVVLVGHGVGGDTAVSVAEDLNSLEFGFRKVNLLVTIDSFGSGNDIIPQNVEKNFNFISEDDGLFNDNPNIAKNNEMTNVINELRSEGHLGIDESEEVQFKVFDEINKMLGPEKAKINLEFSRLKDLMEKSKT